MQTELSRHQIYARSEAGHARSQRYKAAHPEKIKARDAVRWAIKKGRLKRSKCPCGCKTALYRLEGHHPSYERPLDVVWVCKKYHARLHSK